MKKLKIIALGLSVSLVGVGSFFIYDNVSEGNTQNTNEINYRANTGGTTGTTNVNTENNNLPLYQYNKPSQKYSVSDSHSRIVTGFEKPNSQKGFLRDDYDTDLMKKYIKELSKDYSVGNDKYLILPKKSWDNRAVLFPNSGTQDLKKVNVNDVPDANINYNLKNFLTMVVPANSNNRNFAAAFSKFLKKSSAARRTWDTSSDFLSPVKNYATTENGRCDTLSAGMSDSNSYKSMMSTLYYNTNCGTGGFSGFDLGAFLSTFLEVGEREVYVSDSLTGTKSGSPVVSKDEADRLSADGNVDLDTKATINTDIVKWLSSLTIDKVGEIPTIFQKIQDKLTLDGTQDAAAIIEEVIKSSSKITNSDATALMQTMLTVITGFNAAGENAREKGLETSFLSSTKDILSTLVSAGQDSINELVQDLLFDDDDYNDFFLEYGYDSLFDEFNESKSKIESEIKISENKIDFSNNELKELKTTLNKLNVFINNPPTRFFNEYKMWVEKDKVDKDKIRDATLQLTLLEAKKQRSETLTNFEADTLRDLPEKIQNLKEDNRLTNLNIDELSKDIDVIRALDSIKKRDKVQIEISSINADIKVETNKIKTKKAELTVINRQLNHLVNMKKATSVKEYSKNVEMVDIIKLSYSLIKNTASKLLVNLNLGEFDANGDLVMKDLSFSMANLDAIRPLFHDKTSVGGINKIIGFVNRIANKFTGDSLDAATKLIYNLVPKSVIDFVNTDFNVLGKTMSFATGINIGSDITYGLLTSAGTLGGTGIGAGVGAGIGALIGGKAGAKVGALAGAGIGALAGTGAGAGTAYHYFNDGKLVITKPNDALLGIFKSIEKLRNKGEATYFNLFTDGHTLIKQTYLKQLNNLFTEMAKVFLYGESIYKDIEDFHDEKKQFTAWNMVGEALKTLMLSPNILLKVLKGSSYENVGGLGLFKQEIVNEILENLNYSKELIKTLSKSEDDDYIDILQYVQTKAVKWFTDASFLTSNNEANPFGTEEIKIGYNPDDIKLETLKELVAKFKSATGASNEVKYIEVNENEEKKADSPNGEELTIRFDYMRDNVGNTQHRIRDFLGMTEKQESDTIIAPDNDPIYVPIMETKFVAVVNEFNSDFRFPYPSIDFVNA